MKIEIGESLIYSYLRHNKQCLVTQTNWKASGGWDISESIKEQAISEFLKIQKHNEFGKIFPSEIDQTIKQTEIDVIGIDANNTIFAFEVAFHEDGLSYGDKTETREKLIKKLLRIYITLMCYFPDYTYSIAFCSPKVRPATEKHFLEYFEILTKDFKSDNATFHYYLNEDFNNEIIKKTLISTLSEADTSELFIRSVKLLNLSNKFNSSEEDTKAKKNNKIAELSDNEIYYVEDSGESIQNFVKRLMRYVFKNKLLSTEELEKLHNKQYCQKAFGLQYPLLRDISDGYVDSSGRSRYWSTEVFNGQYYVCSQWWKEKTNIYSGKLQQWLKSIEN